MDGVGEGVDCKGQQGKASVIGAKARYMVRSYGVGCASRLRCHRGAQRCSHSRPFKLSLLSVVH